jgi:hypothetical protein
MRDMRKRAGNMLLLSPVLMHNVNLFNSRVMLLVATAAWTEPAMWSVWKTTPEADRTLTVQLASGAGEDVLRTMWQKVVEDSRELARLGWQVVAGLPVIDVTPCTGLGQDYQGLGVPVADIPGRLMSFLLHFMEQRFWAYAWYEWALPEGFAAVISPFPGVAEIHLQRIRSLYLASFDAESAAFEFPAAATLRSAVHWLSWPVCQWLLRTLAHFHFTSHPAWLYLFRAIFTRIGDTKAVEESHKIGRAAEKRGQQPDVFELAGFFRRLGVSGTPLQHRGLQHVVVPKEEFYSSPWSLAGKKPKEPWAVMFGKKGKRKVLPREWGCEALVDGKTSHISPNPDSGRLSITAAQALVYLHQRGEFHLASDTWSTSLFLGTLLHHAL